MDFTDALVFPLPTSGVCHTVEGVSLDLLTQTLWFGAGCSSTCTYLINGRLNGNEHKAIQVEVTSKAFLYSLPRKVARWLVNGKRGTWLLIVCVWIFMTGSMRFGINCRLCWVASFWGHLWSLLLRIWWVHGIRLQPYLSASKCCSSGWTIAKQKIEVSNWARVTSTLML